MPQVEINNSAAEPPKESEVRKAIGSLSNGKAQGSDSFPAKIFEVGGPVLTQKLTEQFLILWQQEVIPQDLKDASITHLYERKGNMKLRDNHRGISFLVITGKIIARVLLNRLLHHLEDGYLGSQCGFRKGRGTADMVFAVQEKCQEQNRTVIST